MAVSMLSSLVAKLGAGGQGACLLVGTRLEDGKLLAVDTINPPVGDSSVPGFDAIIGEAGCAHPDPCKPHAPMQKNQGSWQHNACVLRNAAAEPPPCVWTQTHTHTHSHSHAHAHTRTHTPRCRHTLRVTSRDTPHAPAHPRSLPTLERSHAGAAPIRPRFHRCVVARHAGSCREAAGSARGAARRRVCACDGRGRCEGAGGGGSWGDAKGGELRVTGGASRARAPNPASQSHRHESYTS
jgi:hypothetical protein